MKFPDVDHLELEGERLSEKGRASITHIGEIGAHRKRVRVEAVDEVVDMRRHLE